MIASLCQKFHLLQIAKFICKLQSIETRGEGGDLSADQLALEITPSEGSSIANDMHFKI